LANLTAVLTDKSRLYVVNGLSLPVFPDEKSPVKTAGYYFGDLENTGLNV
jgi:hypothetical protein